MTTLVVGATGATGKLLVEQLLDMGQKVKEANRTDQTVLVHQFDLDAIEYHRQRWCLFRDRRPEHYGPIMTLDGRL